jgi:hypothetical protein
MLVIATFAVFLLALFLLGVLIVGVMVTMRYGDPSASYKLYGVRDRLIGSVVFEGVPRDDPWFDVLYSNVNSVLVHSNLLGGPEHWPLAVAVGEYQANHPKSGKSLKPVPTGADCPAPLKEIGDSLRDSLKHLSANHMGIYLQLSARQREERRIQKEKAKNFLDMIGPGDGSHAAA